MARIKTIEHDQATGRLLEIYDNLILKRGQLANVHKIQSLRPESIVKHMDLYMEIMYSKSPLSRAEREMIAVVVSKANDCSYCQKHHADALNHYWKNDDKIELFRQDFRKINLTEKEVVMCDFAEKLTLNPSLFKNDSDIKVAKANGLSDEAILDLVLVVAYFNFVNRIVLSLDVCLEESEGDYKY